MNNRTKLKLLLLSSAGVLAVIVGITYAWFMQNASMTTLLSVEKPDTITISDMDGSDMTELDLDYREDTDTKDAGGKIHIFRPICIKSTNPTHQLEIVHTTNLESLEFKIYPVGTDKVFNKNETGDSLTGGYVNLNISAETDDKTASQENLQNYTDTDIVDTYAYPLYWLAQVCFSTQNGEDGSQNDDWCKVESEENTEFDVATKSVKTFYYTYYYLEISWLESTKETDLFYIMARDYSE